MKAWFDQTSAILSLPTRFVGSRRFIPDDPIAPVTTARPVPVPVPVQHFNCDLPSIQFSQCIPPQDYSMRRILLTKMSIRAFPAGKTCEDIIRDGAKPPPDADISGLGVILAFTLSAYLTFLLVLASYIFGQVDASLLNTVDTHVFRIRPLKDCSRDHRPVRFRISLALRQAIIALSDQQIVTGIAIMAAGFQGLRLGGIDSYHYQTVIYLAWMSSSVHLSAISLLAPLLKERPALRIWRFTGMLVLLILLIVGLVPTIGNAWGLLKWPTMVTTNTRWGVPAVCFWETR